MSGFQHSIEVRVKSILLNLDIVSEYLEEKAVNLPSARFLQVSKQVSEQMRLKSKIITEIIKKANIPLTLRSIQQLLLTWMDSDFEDPAPEHVVVLLIGLLMAREWIEAHCKNPKVAALAIQPIKEFIFALSPRIPKNIPVVTTLFALSGFLPLDLMDIEIDNLSKETNVAPWFR